MGPIHLWSKVPNLCLYQNSELFVYLSWVKIKKNYHISETTACRDFKPLPLDLAYSKTFTTRISRLSYHYFLLKIFLFCQLQFNTFGKISYFLDFEWEKCNRLLETPFSSFYDMQFLRNQCFKEKQSKLGSKSIKIKWDLSNYVPRVLVYAYIKIQNSMFTCSGSNSRKPIISQKLLLVETSNHCLQIWHTPKPSLPGFQGFLTTISYLKLKFSFFASSNFIPLAKFHIFLILSGKNASKLLETLFMQALGHAKSYGSGFQFLL